MSLAVGTRLGPYEILSVVGAGGMGEVYRARDTKLNRDVAIKVLLPAVANDQDRLSRFAREAQLLASLNHPNITHIHGFEDSGGVPAIVMEFVEGASLADRIALARIPIDEALPIARQIAEALEAAHELGIIHRDLKPANIKVRPDGTVKVLDFGLAKVTEPPASSPVMSQSPTITPPAMTQAGMILGTAAYMSPEQARGKTVDKRADIWAFGVVVFEMLTGRRAFVGEDVSITLASVMMKDPDWGALPTLTPVGLRRLLARCLNRDAKARMRDIGEARQQIEELLSGAQEEMPIWTPDGQRVIFASTRAGSFKPVLAGGRQHRHRRSVDDESQHPVSDLDLARWDAPNRPRNRAQDRQRSSRVAVARSVWAARPHFRDGALTAGPRQTEPLIVTAFNEENGEISADGHWLAYQSNASGRDEISVRPFPHVDSGHWQISPGGGTKPAWARNGRELFYLDGTDALTAVSVHAVPTFSADAPTKLFDARYYPGLAGRPYDVSPDGQRFLMIKDNAISEQSSTAPSMIVVVNWFTELQQRVPTR